MEIHDITKDVLTGEYVGNLPATIHKLSSKGPFEWAHALKRIPKKISYPFRLECIQQVFKDDHTPEPGRYFLQAKDDTWFEVEYA